MFFDDDGNFRIRKINLAALQQSDIADQVCNISVYPNPVYGVFNMSVAAPFDEEAHITVTNMIGEKVLEFTTVTNAIKGMNFPGAPGHLFLVCNDRT